MRIVDDGMARRAGIACAAVTSGEDAETGKSTTRCSGPSLTWTTRSRCATPRRSKNRAGNKGPRRAGL